MTDSIILRAAKSLYELQRIATADPNMPAWESLMPVQKDMRYRWVRHTLAAIRIPSEGMIADAKHFLNSATLDVTPFKPEEIFSLMIDSALKEPHGAGVRPVDTKAKDG